MPPGLTFVSCSGGFGVTCTQANGTVSARVTTFFPNQITIVARASGSPGATISNTATVSSSLPDGNPGNNSITTVSGVALGSAPGNFQAVAAGRGHGLAVLQNGTVLAWGGNSLGQLGDGTTADRYVPGPVSGLTNVTKVASSAFSNLALKSDGTLWAWGNNNEGQLGDGTQTHRFTPVQVSGLTGVIAIASGDNHSVALKSDGTVMSWGAAALNGDGTLIRRLTPVQVSGQTNVIAIAAYGGHTLALKADGTIWSWGANGAGELGDGATTLRPAPVQVLNLTGVTAIGAGDEHSLAVRQDGTVWAWGNNSSLQIGQPNASFINPTPLLVNGINGAIGLVGGGKHSMAVRADATVWGWGDNNRSQLGPNGPGCCRHTPLPIVGVANVMALATGGDFSLALLSDGALRTWGGNSSGQLGDGTTMERAAPQNVTSIPFTATPLLTPPPGFYATPQNVVATCSEPDAVLRYTTDFNSVPTDSSPTVLCGTTFRIDYSLTLKIRAWRPGAFPSSLVGGEYIIGSTNNIDRPDFFVRQQYRDFLGREPDTAGQSYWTNEITRCALEGNCARARRIGVSAAFFVEAEFQDTGYFVYRLYRASLGRRPTYSEFTNDRELVVGGASLELLRQAFANDWTQRAAFLQEFPLTQTNAQFVNKLFDNAGLTGFAAERQSEINAMNNAGRTRAQVLRNVIELNTFRQREYNAAFVLMQYFGYLRREIDQAGYDFWLDVVTNREPGNYRGMVCAFITSGEYQLRFGANITRSNSECAGNP